MTCMGARLLKIVIRVHAQDEGSMYIKYVCARMNKISKVSRRGVRRYGSSLWAATMMIMMGGADFSTAANCVGLSRLFLAYQPVMISDLLTEARPLC
jgi:hypothetical protein